MGNSPMEVIEAVSVSKEYRDGRNILRAVDQVSFVVSKGEFAAVTGASGSGKSTLLRILGGLDKPTEGCVLIHGVNLNELSEEERTQFRLHHVGYVFQDYNLLPVVNVLENIILPAKLLKRTIEREAVEKLADRLGIGDTLYRRPGELSGGQQQRAAIARALYTMPQILLADEPTGNLDSKSAEETIHMMREMCEEYHQTMLIVTHDERISQTADRIIRMEDGKIVEKDG